MDASLQLVWSEDGEEQRLPLSPTEVTSLGRDPACAARFANLAVSRRHAEVRPSEAGWTLRALSRSSPTWLNGALLVGDAPLRAGDVVRLGVIELRAREVAPTADPSTDPSADPSTGSEVDAGAGTRRDA